MCNVTGVTEMAFMMYFFLSCPSEIIKRKCFNNAVAIPET